MAGLEATDESPSGGQANPTFNKAGIIEGARQSVPIALGIFAYGIVFGVLASQAHLSLLESLLMSTLVFAGSSQFTALGLWVAPLPVLAIVLTTLVINLGHILMGAAVRSRLANANLLQKYLSLFLMSDESWALTMGYFASGGTNGAFLLGSGVMAFAAWLTATLVGETAGGYCRILRHWALISRSRQSSLAF